MYKLLILSLLLVTFQLTGLSQTCPKSSIKTNYIEFGAGGGFSGASNDYLLTQSGDLYIIKNILANPDSLTYLKKIKPSTVKKIFCYAKKKKITGLTFNEPGNIYHYMNLCINNKKKRLVWGNPNTSTPENILTLSIKLNNLL